MSRSRTASTLLALGLLALTPACVVHQHHEPGGRHSHASGPPPWAPAHGYRHPGWRGATLVFDRELDCYRVSTRPHHYFHHHHFYRHHHGHWERAEWLRGPWIRVADRELPKGLRKSAKQLRKEIRRTERQLERDAKRAEKRLKKLEKKAGKKIEKATREAAKKARKAAKEAHRQSHEDDAPPASPASDD